MNGVTERVKYKAQVFDSVINAFFRLRDLDSELLGQSRADTGRDVAEAMVSAAVSGLTYGRAGVARRGEAAAMLRALADRVESDGLVGLEWGLEGTLARHAWRPDIRSPEGRAELDARVDLVIEGMMGPARALTVPETRAIVCASFMRMALEHVMDLVAERPDQAASLHADVMASLDPVLARFQAALDEDGAAAPKASDRQSSS